MVLEANKEQCTFRESAESQRKTIKQVVNSFCHNNEMLNGRTMILLLRHSAIIFYCVIQCVWQFNQWLCCWTSRKHQLWSETVLSTKFFISFYYLYLIVTVCLFVFYLYAGRWRYSNWLSCFTGGDYYIIYIYTLSTWKGLWLY